MPRVNYDLLPTSTSTVLNPTMTALGVDGIAVLPDPAARILIENASGGPIDLVIQSNLIRDGVALPDKTISIPATSGKRLLKMFLDEAWKQSDGRVWLDGDGLTVAIFV